MNINLKKNYNSFKILKMLVVAFQNKLNQKNQLKINNKTKVIKKINNLLLEIKIKN